MVKGKEPKILTFFMSERQYLAERVNLMKRKDIIEEYSAKGGALTMYAGLHHIPTQDYKLYRDDRDIVQRIEMYQPKIDKIMAEQMKNATSEFPVDLSPQIKIIRLIRREGDLRWVNGREYIRTYSNERRFEKIDFGISGLDNMEDERKLVSGIVQKMFAPEEYWVLDSVIMMREMGPLSKFKLPLRKRC